MQETLIVEFGAGKVGVMRTAEQGENFESGVAFVHQEAHPIGEVVPGRIGKTTDEVGSFLLFHFSNPESLQVVIDDLVGVLASMKAVERAERLEGMIDRMSETIVELRRQLFFSSEETQKYRERVENLEKMITNKA